MSVDLISLFTRLRDDTEGGMAVMGAVAVPLLLAGSAYALNLQSMTAARNDLQSQVDFAVLSAVAYEVSEDEQPDYTKIVHDIMITNGFSAENPAPTVTDVNGVITAKAQITHPVIFGGFIGRETTDIHVTAQARAGNIDDTVDIVLVLDNTASMGMHGRMGALRTGAEALIDNVETSGSQSRIAMVPFAKYVNVGLDKRNESWLSIPTEYDTTRTWQQATHHAYDCRFEMVEANRDGVITMENREVCDPTHTTYETLSRVIETRWEGCVGSRGRTDDLRDDVMSSFDGMLNIIPYEVSGESVDLKTLCPQAITPLTSDYNALRADVISMFPTDETYMPMGIMWGVRTLSPDAPITDVDTGSRKAMVILSDGMNSSELLSSQGPLVENAPVPYISSTAGNVATMEANADTLASCDMAKAQGIEVYTIAFGIPDFTTQTLLRNCASSPDKAFSANDNAALVETFRNLRFGQSSAVRLVR